VSPGDWIGVASLAAGIAVPPALLIAKALFALSTSITELKKTVEHFDSRLTCQDERLDGHDERIREVEIANGGRRQRKF